MTDERWLRFPIALLAYQPESPVVTLDAIIDYCLWTVGGSERAREITSRTVDSYAKENKISARKCSEHQRLIRGALILNINGGDCDRIVSVVNSVHGYLSEAGSAGKNMANLNSELFWRAVRTARGTEEKQELSWRDFRFISAVLSKVGAKKFDRCGWLEIQARAAGWCGKLDMLSATTEEQARRCPLILTQDQIRATRDELEACNFFCRVKWRTGGKGNGGESWYSFSTKTGDEGRAELMQWISEKKYRMKAGLIQKRALDVALIARIPNPSRT